MDWAESSGHSYSLSNDPPARRSNLKDQAAVDKTKERMAQLLYQDLGRLDFMAALLRQEQLIELKQRQGLSDFLLFVEHPHVYTIGRGGDPNNVLAAKEVPLYRTSRGGDVTYHGPGQLVIYPIIDLRSKLRKEVHCYVRNLEMTAIETLKHFGLKAKRRPPYTGIWIDDRKIAAMGIAVRRGITFHGLALNVNTDLSYFKRIIPCGLTWADVTSMAKELGTEQSLAPVREKFFKNFVARFGYSDIHEASEFLPGQNETNPDRRGSFMNYLND